MSPSAEDMMAEQTIQKHQNEAEQEGEGSEYEYWVEASPEEHYNYYGDRGVVDLFLRTGSKDGKRTHVNQEHVFEFKSETAIRDATGANEVIRQFKRHCRYFYQDPSRDCKVPYQEHHGVTFVLGFEPTEYNYNHFKENIQLYKSLPGRNWDQKQIGDKLPIKGVDCSYTSIRVAFLDTEEPIQFTVPTSIDIDTWEDEIEDHQSSIAEKIGVASDE